MARKDSELTAEDRYEARRAKQILDGSGLSLSEAARLAMEARGIRRSTSATIDEAIDGFMRRALAMKLREQTYDFYETKLRIFSNSFDGLTLDDVTRPKISEWLRTMRVARVTAKGYLRSVHALYSWARSQEPPLCRENACESLKVEEPKSEKEPVAMRAAEVRAVLEGVGHYRFAVAIMIFAGVRPQEMAGRRKPPLQWHHVDRKAKMIRIPADIAKTRRARVIEKLPPTLWAWLKGAPKAGNISPGLSREIVRRAWPCLKASRPDLEKWPADICRDTAASHLLAFWGDSERVSTILGHEGKTQLLFTRYRATMTKAEASAIVALRPSEHA
jgi:integrase